MRTLAVFLLLATVFAVVFARNGWNFDEKKSIDLEFFERFMPDYIEFGDKKIHLRSPKDKRNQLKMSSSIRVEEPIPIQDLFNFEKLVRLSDPEFEIPKKLRNLKKTRFDDVTIESEEVPINESVEDNVEESVEEQVEELEEMRRSSGEDETIETVESIPILKVQPAQNLKNTGRLRTACYKPSGKKLQHKTYPRSWEHAGFEAALPNEWDWRNVSGINYCSPTRNQHIPVYCGSCWVFGSLGALNDRFNVARKGRWPLTFLSPQEIIDCNGKGSCQGGEMTDVYGYAKNHGLVEEGCNNYRAVNGKCDPYHRCGTCWPDSCDPIQNFTKYYVKNFGPLSGRLNMMAEIHNRGPIACSIGATPSFDFNYTGGIYREFADNPSNHIVSVSGWKVDEITKEEYWIVRNSWGEAWGEKGWFRIVTSLYLNGRGDMYNMGIERDCYFADPDVSNLD